MMLKIGALIFAILALSALSMALGDQSIALVDIVGAIIDPDGTSAIITMILFDIRLPRIAMALLAGGALGVAGVLSQTILRNPLAEPGLLGINSGAALAATVVLVSVPVPSPSLLPVVAFVGALSVAIAILGVASLTGPSPVRLVLVGTGFGALVGSLATAVSLLGDIATAQRIMIWLTGSVYRVNWDSVYATALWLILPVTGAILLSRELDLSVLGEGVATGLGQKVRLVRCIAIGLCALLAAISVAAVGVIIFVGLIAPHISRLVVGRRHIVLVPVSGVMGGIVVLAADLVGRTLMPPLQIPAGLITPLIGAPLLAAMVWLRHSRLSNA